MNKKQRMYERIERHGLDLIDLFELSSSTDPIKLCKKLRRIELEASRITAAYANGEIDGNTMENKLNRIEIKLVQILPTRFIGNKVTACWFINCDPRGYALKVPETLAMEHHIYKDWGGYGIIAPDFSEN